MDTNSVIQSDPQSAALETAEELAGTLEIPADPVISTGYADIYHGFWTSLQGVRVEVAVKQFKNLVPRVRLTEQEELKKKKETRIKREVFVWSQITHPNLQPLLGYRLEPQPRLISPWRHHGNLEEYLRENPDLSRHDKLQLIYQAGRGLEYLHSRTPPICHADIKPENVLITDSRGTALSDFGLSRVLQELEISSGFTTTESVKGTVRYMASELFAGQKANLEADVYAFGGLILTVMSGRPPFDGLLYHVILRRVMQNEPPIPKDHPNLPAYDPLWKLMRRCWDKTPAARPGMLEVLRELENDISYGSTAGNRISEAVLLAAREMLKTLQVNSLAIPVLGKYIVTAAEVGLNLVEIVQTLNRSENIPNSLELNPLELANLLKGLMERSKQRRGDDILACVNDLKKKLEYAQEKLGELYTSDLLRNEDFLFDPISHQTWQGTIQRVLEEIQLLAALDTSVLVAEFENLESQEQHRRLLDRLGDGKYGAHGSAIEDNVCLPGTRVGVLERIDNWIRDTSTPDRVLWICGMAGRGKSTIASTVAHNWQHRASCAIFHFRRGHNTLNARIVCALARQLGSSLIPDVRKAILESVQENEDIADQRLDVQFETLIVEPLSKLASQSRTILLIIDALDEFQNFKDGVDFVKLIDRHSSSFPTNVKFLLTCRPEAPLLRALEPRGWQEEALDLSVNVEDDLARFIEQGCARIREEHGLPQHWPARSDVERMVELSQGLFQWARTVITYIGNGSPANRLRAVLKQPSTWSGLDNLYHQILSKAFDNVSLDAERQAILFSVLGSLVVAPYPVSLEVIAAVYSGNSIFKGADQQGVIQYLRQDILADLSSLIIIPTSSTESMHFMHTSIRDLLVDKRRCKERVYFIDVRHHHEQLASLCLGIMLQCLKENICDLSDLSKPNSEIQDVIERRVSTDIRYCCRAWSIHLIEGVEWSWLVTKGPDGQQGYFATFSREKLLHWLEVMSLIGATPEAVVITKRVSSWLSQSHDWVLTRLWHDAHRFITAFSEPISFGALHIYASALAHCPQKTQLWECYGRHAKIRTLHGVEPSTWSANLWTRASGGHVHTIAFSPDGNVLASGSDDGTIRLWDTQTGTSLGQPLTGYTGEAVSVVFSPDGRVLASGSDDGTIRLWDAQIRTPLGQPLTGHTDWVASIAFSPDGRALASGSWDRTIRLWDAQTGTPLGQPLTDHTGWVVSVAFSPDGRVLASGSDDRTIRLWDAQTGTPLGQPLTGHNRSVRSVAFSPDGKVLASGSFDRTIRLWDAQTGAPLGQPLTGHNHWVLSVAFSPDGWVLASGSDDRTIRLWDAETGTPLGQPLTGHNDSVRSVAFSPDSRVLVSGSSDRTIRLWDAQAGVLLSEPLTDHNDYVHSIAFSPDGKLLASGSDDGTIRLWDPQTGTPLGEPLTGHNDYVDSLVFSPDSQVLVSRSNDATIRLWDTQTGAPLGKPLVAVNYMISFVPIPHTDPQESSGPAHGISDIQDHWVNLSGSRLFWLPSHFWVERPPTILLSNEALVINVNGTFSIFDVSLALKLS